MNTIRGILGLIFKIYVGLVFVTTFLIFYVPILICLSKESWKKAAFQVHIVWSYTFRFFAFLHVIFKKKAPLPEGPYIIIANHSSYLDIFVMYSIMPSHPFLFLGKSEILNYPLFKTLFKRLNIPVFRKDRIKAAKSFIQAKNALNNGWSIVIFPEATIPDENWPQMIPFKEGAFKLAKSANVPIVPLTFTNNYKLLSIPECILGQARPGFSHVYIHDFIDKEKVLELSAEELMKLSFDIINEPILATHPNLKP